MKKTDLQICDELSLPLDIITMRSVEYGDSGSGKTAYARLLAEKVHAAHHRFCAIDLKNDWWGLKSSADGSSEGIPVVIFGGPRGDLQLIDGSGAAVADAVAGIEQSVIVDLDAMSRRKQEMFLASFLDRLYEKNREPLLLFCDEADRYAPQKPMTQDAILSLSSSEDIARRGRKRGIGSNWLTQRTAVLNKNVSEFGNLTVVFRTPGSKDLAELEDRVGRIADKATVKSVLSAAPGLADGEAFFLSSHPKLRPYMPDPVRPIQLPLPWTFDSSATPSVGRRRREPKVLARTDIAAIQSKLAAQVEQAKAQDPRELRRRIVELETAAKSAPPPPPRLIKVPLLPAKALDKLAQAQKALEVQYLAVGAGYSELLEAHDQLQSRVRANTEMVAALREDLARASGDLRMVPPPPDHRGAARNQEAKFETRGGVLTPYPPPIKTYPAAAIAPAPDRRRPPRAEMRANGDGAEEVTISRMMRKFLTTLAQHGTPLKKDRILALTGYSNGGDVSRCFADMLRAHYAVMPERATLLITPEGAAALGEWEPLPVGKALRDQLTGDSSKLSTMERKFLRVIFEAYPHELSKTEVLHSTSYSSGGDTSRAFAKLARSGWIDKRGPGKVRASDAMFTDQIGVPR